MSNMISADVTINLTGLKRFGKQFNSQLVKGTAGPIKDMVLQWAAIYRSDVQLRFDKFSKGGGDWSPLSPRTIAQRRQGSSTILRDTNTLFTVLNPVFSNQPGALQEHIRGGIRIGFGGSSKHPDGGSATIADIASFHHFGRGNLPERKLLVTPSPSVRKRMVDATRKAAEKLRRATE